VVAGHSEQFAPGGYLLTVKHTALAVIEPTTFRLLVRRGTETNDITAWSAPGNLPPKQSFISVAGITLQLILALDYN